MLSSAASTRIASPGQSATRNGLDLDPDAVAREVRREVGTRWLADLTALGLRIDDP